MNIQRQLMIACFLLIGVEAANAQSESVNGVIRFRGNIVESSCMAGGASETFVDLVECPQANTGQVISVRNVSLVDSNANNPQTNVTAQLIAYANQRDHYYTQRYMLRDGEGKPVNSGNYLVTLTLP